MIRQPYHLRKLFNKELKRLIENDIIEYTQGLQKWASNVVATPKSNGRIRLCLDARDKLHICLYGKHFHAFVDHQPLKHIFKPRSKLNAKLFR